MGLQLPIKTAIFMMGVEDDLQRLKTSNISYHNVVHTDTDGTTRSILLKIMKEPDDTLRIKADYLLHAGQNYIARHPIVDVCFDEMMGIQNASILGQAGFGKEKRIIYKIIKDLKSRVGVEKEWTNFIKVIESAGLGHLVPSSLNWPGISGNGEIQAIKSHKIESESEPVFPADFLPGIIGCGPEAYAGEKEKAYTLHVSDSEKSEDILLSYKYKRDNNPLSIQMSCYITRVGDEDWEDFPLYELQTAPVKENQDLGKIKFLRIHHANAPAVQLDKVEITNQKSLSIALKAVRMMTRTARAGEQAFRDENEKIAENRRLYMPSDIMALSGLNDVMMPQTPATKRGRFCFTPMGGQNTKRVFSDFDYHIGGNSYRFDYYPPESKTPESLITDMGVLFHDDFDLSFTNLGRYFKHKTNRSLKSDYDVKAIMFTHRHKDHISQLAQLVKHGYDLPSIMIPPMASRQIVREMRELGIETKTIKEIESKFVPLDHNNIPPEATENNPHNVKIAGETIELFWEHIEGDRLGQYHRYPAFKIGDGFKVRCGPMPHSDPGFMYEVITRAGSHLHTGDFKMDPTIQLFQPCFRTWLRNCTTTTVSVDSTGAMRNENERTTWESEIQKSVAKLVQDNPNHRFIVPILGSNASRFTTLIAAMADAGKEYLVVNGKALEDLTDDLNAIYDLKKWAMREYGITIVKRGSKEANRILKDEPDSKYVVAVTGTQLEPTSSLNRALANWLPNDRYEIGEDDIIVPLQGPIPVGDNMQRRWAAKYFSEVFHGCRFVLPEAVEKEFDLKLSGSGHASPMDLKELYSYLKNLKTVFPVHGGPDQLAAGAKIAEGEGYEAIIADNFDNHTIDKKGDVQKLKTETAEMVGIKSHLPDQYSFWLRRQFSTTVAPIPINDNSPVGKALNQFERGLRAALNLPARDLLKSSAIFHLSRTFNMSAQGGFLTGRYKFGIEKLDQSIWDAKAIGVVSAFDTETTGTDERFDFICQFSMTSYDLNRRRLGQIEHIQKLPGYAIPNPEALLVTATEPEKKDDRELHPVLFADQIIESLNTAKVKAKEIAKERLPQMFRDNQQMRAKMLFIAHNFPFDDRQLKALFKDTLSPSARPHATDGVIGIDTLHIARAIHAIYPEKLKVRKYDDSDYLNYTLQALCEENGISYDLSKAHNSALYDSERAIKLFWKMHDAAPDIVEQMIFNADSSKGHLLNDMVGYDTGFNGQHPVFSYLSKRRDRTDLRMGCFVGTIDGGSKAVIANLSQNPQDVLSLSPNDIANRLADRDDDSLEIIDLRQNPMVFSAKYFYEQNTSKKFPREMFDRRARIVKEYINFRDADLGMTNIHERLSQAWDDKKGAILIKYNIVGDREPDLNAQPIQILKDAQNYKQSMRNDKPHGARKSFNPPAQNTIKSIKSYREVLVKYLSSDKPSQRQTMVLNSLYKAVMEYNKPTEGQRFLVANLHYDIAPNIIEPELRKIVEAQRAFHTKHSLDRAVRVMDRLETDQDHFDIIIGRSLKKRKIFQILKNMIGDLKQAKPYDANAAKNAVTPWQLSA